MLVRAQMLFVVGMEPMQLLRYTLSLRGGHRNISLGVGSLQSLKSQLDRLQQEKESLDIRLGSLASVHQETLQQLRPDLLDVLLLELAQLQNRPGWPVKKKKKKSRQGCHFLVWHARLVIFLCGNDNKAMHIIIV